MPRYLLVLLTLLLAKLGLHLYLNPQWSFHRDELLYLALGRRLDWGYASVPPNIGFWGWFSQSVLGGSVSAVRSISTLALVATVGLTGLMAVEMLPKPTRDGRFAVLLVGLAGLTAGAFLRPAMLFQPVAFDLFYWTLFSWLFVRYVQQPTGPWVWWMGAAVGLAFLNKYSILMAVAGVGVGALLTPARHLFADRRLYGAMGLALLIASPNLWTRLARFPPYAGAGGDPICPCPTVEHSH